MRRSSGPGRHVADLDMPAVHQVGIRIADPGQTPTGAAVQLRRLDAMLDDEDEVAVGLLESALKAVEGEALSVGPVATAD